MSNANTVRQAIVDANEEIFEGYKSKILDTSLTILSWQIWSETDKEAQRDSEKLEAIAFKNEDLFIDYFDGFVSFPRITTGEFLEFLEEMAEAKHLPNRNREKVIAELNVDINEVYEILARESDKRFEEGA